MPGLEPSYENIIKQELEIADLKRAIAEKDLEWKRRVGLDCGGHSCYFAIEKKGMRHNGPCTCNPKRTKEDHDRLYKSYHALMGQAVRFAEHLSQELPGVYIYVHSGSCGPETACDSDCMNNAHIAQRNSMIRKAQKFLASPEVREWRKQEEQP